jgi:hypothetical protein
MFLSQKLMSKNTNNKKQIYYKILKSYKKLLRFLNSNKKYKIKYKKLDYRISLKILTQAQVKS